MKALPGAWQSRAYRTTTPRGHAVKAKRPTDRPLRTWRAAQGRWSLALVSSCQSAWRVRLMAAFARQAPLCRPTATVQRAIKRNGTGGSTPRRTVCRHLTLVQPRASRAAARRARYGEARCSHNGTSEPAQVSTC